MDHSYQHRKLPSNESIRLIRLFPGKSEDTLECEILYTDLTTHPNYEAVSYVWGAESDPSTISMKTENGVQSLPITRNLAIALRRFRYPSSIRTLWTDSICINQKDDIEKSVQVPLMGMIYRQATKVIVWLGEDPNVERRAKVKSCINCLNTAYHKIRELEDQRFENLPPNTTEYNEWLGISRGDSDAIHQSLDIPPLSSLDFQGLLELLRTPWFSRAWTWQESFVARDVDFYRDESVWSRFQLTRMCICLFRLSKVTGKSGEYGDDITKNMQMLQGEYFWKSDSKYCKFSEILKMRRGSGCKFKSDLIYSLLGGAQQCPKIEVRYEDSFEDVFARSTWEIISQQGDLSILYEIERTRQSTSLPSWTPGWHISTRKERDFISLSKYRYRATGSSRLQASISQDLRVLSLKGFYWDQISEVHPSDAHDVEQWVGNIFKSPEKLTAMYNPTNESLEYALRRVYFLDTTAFLGNDGETRWQSDSHEKYEKIMNNALSSGQEGRTRYGKLLQSMVIKRDMRAIIVTKNGRLGMAANTVQVGDTIAMLLGCDRPIALRPMTKVDSYTFVADCYIHGFMDGESLMAARKGNTSSQDVEDRAWLDRLHENQLPFSVQDFHIY